ncbi:bestrophin family ion channel [Polyangium sp. y55x31]|uniref:bestrophin family protein n=1 Tax=Polyangium sp. y55x31 TaxID=3042688 RepID=UPI002482C247|nr:bestrophin family ion channel [Polyangium sp. y55x31]MDI1476136.1 bestrophin family ion channel [Polyangium sp. y55x31]
MVISNTLPWLNILRMHAPHLAVVFAVALGLYLADALLGVRVPFSPTPFSIVGVALAILLGFRNNASYDRWWEGRKLWGGIVNASRALARQTTTLLEPGVAEPTSGAAPGDDTLAAALKREILYRQIAYVHALRAVLRQQNALEGLAPFLPADELAALAQQKNVPVALMQTNGERLAFARRAGLLSEERLLRIDATLVDLIGLQGGCERIKNTPIPAGYRVFTHRSVRAYCYVLPFGLVEHLGALTTIVVMAVTLMFLVLDTIGRFLEDPFTTGPNALPLMSITRNIEINLRQALGETDLPPAITPTTNGKISILL